MLTEPKETVELTMREIDRLKVLDHALSGRLLQREAAAQLGLSSRQIKRLCRRVREKGPKGIAHALRGRPSNHCLSPGLLERALDLVRTRYPDFGPTFAREKLEELHGLRISTYALRGGMVRAGLWRARRYKPFHRAWRERRACPGELVQLDGSEHDWFEGRGPRCTLIAYVDDATSKILWAEFAPSEDTLNLMRLTWAYLRRYGRPTAFYVDRDSIYKVNRQATLEEELRDENPMSQFYRAMQELGVEVIFAYSPQAKGRVERVFKTLQDRLVKELRLRRIRSIEQANAFLRQSYLAGYNRDFAVPPANPTDAHKPLLPQHQLKRILSLRSMRTLFNDFTLRYRSKFLQVLEDQPTRIKPRDRIEVESRLDGSTHLRFNNAYLKFKFIPKSPYRPFLATNPARARPRRYGPARPHGATPGKDHPWRRFRLPGSPPCGVQPPSMIPA
jgi:transposase